MNLTRVGLLAVYVALMLGGMACRGERIARTKATSIFAIDFATIWLICHLIISRSYLPCASSSAAAMDSSVVPMAKMAVTESELR